MVDEPAEVDRLARVRGRDGWEGIRVVVAGFGASGFAAADTLIHLGAQVIVVDAAAPVQAAHAERATLLGMLGADLRLGPGHTGAVPDDAGRIELVVTSPGWRPDAPLLQDAARRGIPVWGEVELAWRLRDPAHPAPWLVVTGTNGKTTTVEMLEAMLRAAGLRTTACGNVGLPVVEAVMDPDPYDVLAVELSSFQLHYAASVRAESAVVLNVAEDHLDWHGSLPRYVAAKARVYHGVERACIYNAADPTTEHMVREADVVEGARAIGFTLGIPDVGMLGIVDDVLVDRAFIEERRTSAAELATLADLALTVPHFVEDALAAAALARSHGVPAAAVRAALRSYRPGAHRIAEVARRDGITWVDDSKATNPPAALASLQAFDPVVWIAGGLAKGARFDDLVRRVRDRLRGVVLLGRDAPLIAEALARHAPEVPVITVAAGETGGADPMERVVAEAAALARTGDTVLLAPACASQDMFTDYRARGDAYATAVRRWR